MEAVQTGNLLFLSGTEGHGAKFIGRLGANSLPASGWEKGQVENQVGLVRERFFTPRLRFKSYDELNGWLLRQMRRLRQGASSSGKTAWEVFEKERPKLVPLRGRFDGFHAVSASVSKTCLVRFDNNSRRAPSNIR